MQHFLLVCIAMVSLLRRRILLYNIIYFNINVETSREDPTSVTEIDKPITDIVDASFNFDI